MVEYNNKQNLIRGYGGIVSIFAETLPVADEVKQKWRSGQNARYIVSSFGHRKSSRRH